MIDLLGDKFLEELFNTSGGEKGENVVEDREKVKGLAFHVVADYRDAG